MASIGELCNFIFFRLGIFLNTVWLIRTTQTCNLTSLPYEKFTLVPIYYGSPREGFTNDRLFTIVMRCSSRIQKYYFYAPPAYLTRVLKWISFPISRTDRRSRETCLCTGKPYHPCLISMKFGGGLRMEAIFGPFY